MANITIRPAELDDGEFLAHLSASAFAPFGDYRETFGQFLGQSATVAWIAQVNGARAGFIICLILEEKDAPQQLFIEVLAIAVEPQWQKKGIGQKLLRKIQECAQACSAKWGVQSVQLNVADTNEPAKRLFYKLGFEILSADDGVYPHGQKSMRLCWPVKKSAP